MFKILTLLLLALWCSLSAASPFLTASAWPASNGTLESVTVTIAGGSPVACAVDASLVPKCDLASVATPGTYSIVMSWCAKAGVTNGTNTGTASPGGCVSSVPFSFVLRGAPATAPAVLLAP